jgi:hypothetical protein
MAAALAGMPIPSSAADLVDRFTDMSTRTELDGDSLASSVRMHLIQRDFGEPRVKSFRGKRTLLRYERSMSFAGSDVLLKVRFPGKRRSLLSMELRF